MKSGTNPTYLGVDSSCSSFGCSSLSMGSHTASNGIQGASNFQRRWSVKGMAVILPESFEVAKHLAYRGRLASTAARFHNTTFLLKFGLT